MFSAHRLVGDVQRRFAVMPADPLGRLEAEGARDGARYKMAPDVALMVPRMPDEGTVARLLSLTSASASASDRRGAEGSFWQEAEQLGAIPTAALAWPNVRPILALINISVVLHAVKSGSVPAAFGPPTLLESGFLRTPRGRTEFKVRVAEFAAKCRSGRVSSSTLSVVREAVTAWQQCHI